MTKQQLFTAKPGEILEYIRKQIRKFHNDNVENKSTVYASHGYYCVTLNISTWDKLWCVRRGGIPSLIRHIKSTVT